MSISALHNYYMYRWQIEGGWNISVHGNKFITYGKLKGGGTKVFMAKNRV